MCCTLVKIVNSDAGGGMLLFSGRLVISTPTEFSKTNGILFPKLLKPDDARKKYLVIEKEFTNH